MTFRAPDLLAGLLVVVVLGAAYVHVAFRSAGAPIAHSQVLLLAAASRSGCRYCRHLPATLFFVALAALVIALARPVVPWPAAQGWPVALVIDVSRSMEENDIRPTRIAAARVAAAEFVRGLPRTTPAALVTFGNYPTVVVPPTTDRSRLLEAIAALTTQLRTQLGNGLVEGVRALTGEGGGSSAPAVPPVQPPGAAEARAVAVLLSDGRASDGIPPLEAADLARARGVRVYTVGMGTAGDPSQFRSGYWGVLDEPTLRAIAGATGGTYFHADSATRLRTVYRDLARTIGWTRLPTEASALAVLGALVALAAALALRFRFLPLA